eukprot:3171513-Pleurochrysis_carterae.AAC.1
MRLSASELLSLIPGAPSDRRFPLGELHWILTAVTDAIGWHLLPQPLFRKLFRHRRPHARACP